MSYREIMAVCSEIHTKHINTLCGQNVELLNVKLTVHIVTTGLQRVKRRIATKHQCQLSLNTCPIATVISGGSRGGRGVQSSDISFFAVLRSPYPIHHRECRNGGDTRPWRHFRWRKQQPPWGAVDRRSILYCIVLYCIYSFWYFSQLIWPSI